MRRTSIIYLMAVFCMFSCSSGNRNPFIDIEKGISINDPVNDKFDPHFLQFCLYHFDIDRDGVLTYGEIYQQEILSVYGNLELFNLLEDIKGVEYFTNLKIFRISGLKVKEIDLSQNKHLERVELYTKYLENLDLPQGNTLHTIIMEESSVGALDLSQQTGIRNLTLKGVSKVTELDLSQMGKLESLDVRNMIIDELDMTYCHSLRALNVEGLWLSELLFPQSGSIDTFQCGECNIDYVDAGLTTKIDNIVIAATVIKKLEVHNASSVLIKKCAIDNVSLSGISDIVDFIASESRIGSVGFHGDRNARDIKFTDCPELESLFCEEGFLSDKLSLSGCPMPGGIRGFACSHLYISENSTESIALKDNAYVKVIEIENMPKFTFADISSCPMLETLILQNCPLFREVGVRDCPALKTIIVNGEEINI